MTMYRCSDSFDLERDIMASHMVEAAEIWIASTLRTWDWDIAEIDVYELDSNGAPIDRGDGCPDVVELDWKEIRHQRDFDPELLDGIVVRVMKNGREYGPWWPVNYTAEVPEWVGEVIAQQILDNNYPNNHIVAIYPTSWVWRKEV